MAKHVLLCYYSLYAVLIAVLGLWPSYVASIQPALPLLNSALPVLQWVVFADKLTIPKEQLAAYKKLMVPTGYDKTGNSRPVQALQGRQLEYCWL